MKKTTEALVAATKQIGLQANSENTKYMVMFSRPACRTRSHIKIGNKSFERVKQFRYFVIPLTNQHCIHENIKTSLKLGNACYHSEQNILSCSLLLRNIKIKIYRSITLPVILYGCETWSLT